MYIELAHCLNGVAAIVQGGGMRLRYAQKRLGSSLHAPALVKTRAISRKRRACTKDDMLRRV